MGTVQVRETSSFFWTNSQLAGQILFCQDISAEHFQKTISNTARRATIVPPRYLIYIYNYIYIYNIISEFLITCEEWAKLAQQWLVCAPLGIHLEPINKELMLLVII